MINIDVLEEQLLIHCWLSCCLPRVYLIHISRLFFKSNRLGIEVILSVSGNIHGSLEGLEIKKRRRKVETHIRRAMGRRASHSPTGHYLSVGP